MPRGVPNAGYRVTKAFIEKNGGIPENAPQWRNQVNHQAAVAKIVPVIPKEPEKIETDEEIDARIAERFNILDSLVDDVIEGDIRALIVSGPPGLGKSYLVETKLSDFDPNGTNYKIVKGKATAAGLYRILFEYSDEGQILVFDDADSIFFDDNCLNFLKAVCDSNEKRVLSYLSEGNIYSEEKACNVPKTFEFNGTIIFITNYDFEKEIERKNKLAPHMEAMMSRSHYVDLGMKNRRDCLVRILQLIKVGMLNGLTEDQSNEVVSFLKENINNLREVSNRTALKIATLVRKGKKNWQQIAKVTTCKN